ncbi:uncharacterized protein LOC144434258 [Glandiceps talaboti]
MLRYVLSCVLFLVVTIETSAYHHQLGHKVRVRRSETVIDMDGQEWLCDLTIWEGSLPNCISPPSCDICSAFGPTIICLNFDLCGDSECCSTGMKTQCGAGCEPVDHCDPNPCQNGGTCTNLPSSYTCECEAHYTGDNCESQPVDHCDPNPCQNGGTCTNLPASYTCECEAGYTGDNCERKYISFDI